MADEAAGRIAALEQEVAELRQELDACRRIEAFYGGLAGSTTYLMVRADARVRFVFANGRILGSICTFSLALYAWEVGGSRSRLGNQIPTFA